MDSWERQSSQLCPASLVLRPRTDVESPNTASSREQCSSAIIELVPIEKAGPAKDWVV
jgi:hypothetical protein